MEAVHVDLDLLHESGWRSCVCCCRLVLHNCVVVRAFTLTRVSRGGPV